MLKNDLYGWLNWFSPKNKKTIQYEKIQKAIILNNYLIIKFITKILKYYYLNVKLV